MLSSARAQGKLIRDARAQGVAETDHKLAKDSYRIFPLENKSRRQQGFSEVGGTGLEPVTPSLSTLSSVRTGSLTLARSAWLSRILRHANT